MASIRVRVGQASMVALTAACAGQHPRSPAQPTAEQILQTMAETYSRATSYSDRGVRVTEFSAPQPHTNQERFDTAFTRAAGFRFDFDNGHVPTPIVVWTNNGKLHRYWAPGAIEDESDLAIAAHTSAVPRLLLPALAPGTSVAELQHARVAGTEPVDGHPCWRVVGTWVGGDELTVWIDQNTHLLRRTATHHHFPDAIERPAFDTQETTSYEPVLNGAIVASQLSGPDPATLPPPATDPWLGVQLDGTRIVRAIGSSPAEHAGLQTGDELLSLDGWALTDAASFIQRVQRKHVGQQAEIVVRRNGTELAITATVGDRIEFAKLQQGLVDQPAPPFDATVVAGSGPARLADLAGYLTVLDLTPTSFKMCPDCPVPATYLSKLQDKYASRGLRVIGISTEDVAVLQRFAADHQLHYTLAHDDGETADAYHAYGPTTVVLIDRAGRVRWIQPGTTALETVVLHLLDSGS